MINWKKKKGQKRTIIKLFRQNKIIHSPKTKSKPFSWFIVYSATNTKQLAPTFYII